jgi:hypothetical protein
MNTPEYLDAVRKKLGLPSDYALQKPLGLSKSQLSRYRTGLDSFSDAVALQIAEILDIPPAKVLLDCHIERSKVPAVKAAWTNLMQTLQASFELLLLPAGRRGVPF